LGGGEKAMLQGHVLVLNRSWLPVHTTPARRALTLLYVGAARAIHPTDFSVYNFEDWVELSQDGLGGPYIRTPSFRIRVPEVVQLVIFNGFIRHEVRFSRHNIFERDRCTCQYCGRQYPKAQLTIDHVVPQSRSGDESWENLVIACEACNVKKGNRTPEEAGMPLIRHPFKPAWIPHFGSTIPSSQFVSWQRFIDPALWGVSEQKDS
jgi:5-methylcytosine-specific restriction endonuclease McrA